ncbi:hypothetical protein Dsin_023938 [Dipteronia sinensis]|uniref:Uncharacterized protein n=1 Tax=Dipteronia sinensis TaxID=43782 RepID=A0AAE0A4L3_9ROSI|nr:hypothetical protein Dsin_023938 [Dipteronia sinensis]
MMHCYYTGFFGGGSVEPAETKVSDQTNKSHNVEIESFQSLGGDTDAESLEALIGQITSGNSEDSISPIVLSANSDKSHRPVTVFKQHVSRLGALDKRLFRIQVGDFCYVKEILWQLQGNRITVTLRGVVADSEDVIKAAATPWEGMGSSTTLVCNVLEVVLCPLTLWEPHYFEGSGRLLNDISKAREYYKETEDIDGTLRKLPRYLVAERSIFFVYQSRAAAMLKKCPGNYLQALKAFPRTLRMMYVHSYQSYWWKRVSGCKDMEIVKVILELVPTVLFIDYVLLLQKTSMLEIILLMMSYFICLETDLDIIAKARPVDIVKEPKSTNGNEEKDLVDCTKQSESDKNDIEHSTNNSQADCGREVGVTPFVAPILRNPSWHSS